MRTTQNNTTENDGVCDLLNNISTADNEDSISTCANCGKGEERGSILKTCVSCKLVKYCNRECQVAHRRQHKKECRKRAKELHDEELFKQPPPKEDCPICFLRKPTLHTGSKYQSCCGQSICCGCIHAPVYDDQGTEVDNEKCAFCRTPYPTSNEDVVKRLKKRLEANDVMAMYHVGNYYRDGRNGFPQDYTKALEHWHKAAELGYAIAYGNIGYAYNNGEGVEVDKEKAIHYWELAAISGDVYARSNLGVLAEINGNMDRALNHHMLSVRGGYSNAVDNIKRLYSNGCATKEDCTKALRLYQVYLGEIKSRQRDEAAAAYSVRYRYY